MGSTRWGKVTISSRTPEGLPSRCPLCGADAAVVFSEPGGDAPCPGCGHLLWRAVELLERVRERLAETLGVDPEEVTAETSLEDLGADSLDLAEVVMDFEEEFDLAISDADAEGIVTVGDVIRSIAEREGEDGPAG